MAEKKIIAVVGATGAQGGGLVRAILNDRGGDFAVRALTRDVTTEKAKALAELGAELVALVLDDRQAKQRPRDRLLRKDAAKDGFGLVRRS